MMMCWSRRSASIVLLATTCPSLALSPSLTTVEKGHAGTSRRNVISVAAIAPAILSHSIIVKAESTLPECKNGQLVNEESIPGAYDQVCMSLPSREIPVRRGTTDETVVTVEQRPSGAGSTGMAVWNSSLLLKRLLEKLTILQPSWIESKSLVELGCGVGLVSLSSAILGASAVIATDGNPSVVELARQNIKKSELSSVVRAETLSWGILDASDFSEVADLVVGSDLTYNAANWRVLAETMVSVVKPDGFILYLSLGHAGFDVNAESQGFISVAQELGLKPVLPTDQDWPFPGLSVSLTELLLSECVLPEEKDIVSAPGGARVTLLRRKQLRRM